MEATPDLGLECPYCPGNGWIVLVYIEDTNEYVAYCDECYAVQSGPDVPPSLLDLENYNNLVSERVDRLGRQPTIHSHGYMHTWPVPPPKRR